MNNPLEEIMDTNVLTPENCAFYQTPNRILMARIPAADYDGRAFFARAFPFEKADEYISVMDEDKEEKGIILHLSVFDEETAGWIRAELDKKYFAPKIMKITKLNERFGFSYWECESDFGKISFTVKDTYRSIIHVTEDRVYIVDCDGCRYEIESLNGLDKKSYSKLELYV